MDENQGSSSKKSSNNEDDDSRKKEEKGKGKRVERFPSSSSQPSVVTEYEAQTLRILPSFAISGRTSNSETALNRLQANYVNECDTVPTLVSRTGTSLLAQPEDTFSKILEASKRKVVNWKDFPNAVIQEKGRMADDNKDEINDDDHHNISTQASRQLLTDSEVSCMSGVAQTVTSADFMQEINDTRVGSHEILALPSVIRQEVSPSFHVEKQEGTQTDHDPEYQANLKLRPSEIEKLQRLHEESHATENLKWQKSKTQKGKAVSQRTISASIGYSQYRREGEAFLDLEFIADDEDDEDEEFNDDANYDDESNLHSDIISNAEEIKRLVSEKKMGLPQFHSDNIVQMADQIIVHHSNSIYDIFSDQSLNDQTDRLAQNIRNIAVESDSILNILKSKGESMSATKNEMTRETTDHLEKMVRKLHCRHRRMKKLADEIIAKRWKIINMNAVKQKREKGEAVPMASKRRGTERKGRKEKRKGRKLKEEDMKVLYSNPMAKLKTIGKICGDQQNWGDDDPLWKAINKVGVAKFEKCFASSREPDASTDATLQKKTEKRGSAQKSGVAKPVIAEHKVGVFPSPVLPSLEAHFGKSAVTIFMENYSKLIVIPSKVNLPSPEMVDKKSFMMNIDKSEVANDFVEQWKRRSYAVGIFLVILTALLHCAYLTAPRMGDNYLTYTISLSISGPSIWWYPTGIYGMIFLGYLFGSMGVIKTAAALEHHQSVKEYVSQRRKKFYLWYGLAIYFFLVWTVRTGLWFSNMDSTEQEIRHIFSKKVYYKQLPSRLLYTQYLLECCGANGPEDYKESDKIGLPKSCYVRVRKYNEYFIQPQPAKSGCLTEVFKGNALFMSMICSLSLILWLLVLVHPIYLYVYELFLCMKSHVPEPWLEYSKD